MIGLESGMIIFRKITQSFAPSIYADSVSSHDMEVKNVLITITL